MQNRKIRGSKLVSSGNRRPTTPRSDRPRFYILVGDSETWNVSLLARIWGFRESSKGHWNTSEVGDFVAFYVTSPVKKIIGFGRIKRKFIDTTALFPDEKFFGKASWLYRFEFEKLHVVDRWEEGVSVPPNIMLNVGRKVVPDRVFLQLVKKAERKWRHALLD